MGIIFYQQLEVLSGQLLWDFLIAVPILLVWALFPDLTAAVIHMIGERFLNIAYNLPFSRVLENEADEVGLKLAAKVCYTIPTTESNIIFCICITAYAFTNINC